MTAPNIISDDDLVSWIRRATADRRNALASGYQGHIFLYNENGQRRVIKVASGHGPLRWLRARMLRNEFRVYSRLAGFRGCPQCYGLINGRYLVLEYLDGKSLRYSEVEDRAKYYEGLFGIIQEMHRRGVAHFDLKRKANLMVLTGSVPRIIDFGVAIIRKSGFSPINHFLYDLAVKLDFNAWVKLKYNKRIGDASDADRIYYRRTRIEKVGRRLKPAYKWLKWMFRKDRSHESSRHIAPGSGDSASMTNTDITAGSSGRPKQ
ncbi:MAG: hypothetical protein ACYDDO_07505 [Acidiferrobacterales bacterium]